MGARVTTPARQGQRPPVPGGFGVRPGERRRARDIDAVWIEEDDSHLNPMGFKGIGEIGIVGTAAAIAKRGAPRHGHRVRDLPIRLDRLLAMFIEGGSAGRVAGRRGAESLDVE